MNDSDILLNELFKLHEVESIEGVSRQRLIEAVAECIDIQISRLEMQVATLEKRVAYLELKREDIHE